MMNDLFLLAYVNQLWYAVPLIVVVSLAYAATRHELMEPILKHALRFGIMVTVFMVVIFGILSLISSFL